MSNQNRRHQHHSRALRNHRSYQEDLVTTNQSANCSLTICYSYLIAILSSFLVVVGLYLAITKFNARYLYISLAGLLIEATGACIYCLSNIRRSKLARRKQTNHSNLDNANDNSHRQLAVSRMTHILSNNTFNQTAINTTTNAQVDDRQHTATQEVQMNVGEAEQENSTSLIVQRDPNLGQGTQENIDYDQSTPLSLGQSPRLNQNLDTTDSHNDSSSAEQKPIGNPLDLETENRRPHVAIELDREQTTQTKPSASVSELRESTANTKSSVQTVSHNDEVDLIELRQPSNSNGGLQITDLTQDVAKRVGASNSRANNLRRTLVMGLSGEEEIVEIDEEKLDNMSILPPAYESIATTGIHQ